MATDRSIGRRRDRVARGGAAAALLVAFVLVGARPAGAAPTTAAIPAPSTGPTALAAAASSVPNPIIEDECSIDATLVLDASGSVATSGAAGLMRRAVRGFLTTLQDTASTARVLQFATLSGELAPRTRVDPVAVGTGGIFDAAFARYLNPSPQRPDAVYLFRYSGAGSVTDPARYSVSNDSTQYTNWDAAMEQAVDPDANLVVLVTDGLEPTAYDLDQAGDPFDAGPPPDVAVNTTSGAAAEQSLARAVDAANRVKAHARIVVVGVGIAASNGAAQGRLAALSGPQTTVDPDPSALPAINDIDVVLAPRFEDVEPVLRGLAFDLCRSSVVVEARADSPDDPEYRRVGGRAVTVAPAVGDLTWQLPDRTPQRTKTATTGDDGLALFQWQPTGSGATSVAVTSTLPAGYVAGRPAGPDYECRIAHRTGDIQVVDGDFATDSPLPRFDLAAAGSDIVRCTTWSTYDPRPRIAVTTAVSPQAARGDLDPPASAIATFTVTNPGNVPLSGVGIESPGCLDLAPDAANAGDLTPADGPLDPGEARRYTCRYVVRAAPPGTAVAPTLVFQAQALAQDPFGTRVTSSASAGVLAYSPRIGVHALIDGQASATVESGDAVDLGIDVTNEGNSMLGGITVAARPASCSPRPVGTPGDFLAPGRSRRYACTFVPEGDLYAMISVRAQPWSAPGTPIPDPNPPVTATGQVRVTVVDRPAPPPSASAGSTRSPPPDNAAAPAESPRSAAATTEPRPVAVGSDPQTTDPGPRTTESIPAQALADRTVSSGGPASTPTTGGPGTTAPSIGPPAGSASPSPSPWVALPSMQIPADERPAESGFNEDTPFHIDVSMDLDVGRGAAGRTLQADAGRLRPGSPVAATVYSRAQLLFSRTVGPDGGFHAVATLPSALEPGIHTVIVTATSAGGRRLAVAGGFRLDDDGTVAAVAQPRLLVDAQPGDPRIRRALEYGIPAYDPRTDPVGTAGVVTAAALVAGLAGAASSRRRGRGSVKGVIAKRIETLSKVEPGPGDRSGSWRWPLTNRTDGFARWLPTLGASRTVLIARLGLDGTWARAMFGSLGYLLWAAAIALALGSAVAHEGRVEPPPLPLLLALIVVGILDASAGAVGFLVLCLSGLVTVNITTLDDVRTLLGLGSLLIWAALLTNSIRPLRRPGWRLTSSARRERVLDYLIPPLLVGFMAGGVALALNGLSGLELVTAQDATAVRWAVGVAVIVRYGTEDLSALRYPGRTAQLEAREVGWPKRSASLIGNVIGFVIFVFVAEPFFGLTLSTVIAALLTILPNLLRLCQDNLPDSPTIGRWLPRGLLKLLVIAVICGVLAKAFISDGGDDAVRSTMILMILPALAFALLELFGRTAPEWPATGYRRVGGALTWLILVGLTTGTLVLFG